MRSEKYTQMTVTTFPLSKIYGTDGSFLMEKVLLRSSLLGSLQL